MGSQIRHHNVKAVVNEGLGHVIREHPRHGGVCRRQGDREAFGHGIPAVASEFGLEAAQDKVQRSPVVRCEIDAGVRSGGSAVVVARKAVHASQHGRNASIQWGGVQFNDTLGHQSHSVERFEIRRVAMGTERHVLVDAGFGTLGYRRRHPASIDQRCLVPPRDIALGRDF